MKRLCWCFVAVVLTASCRSEERVRLTQLPFTREMRDKLGWIDASRVSALPITDASIRASLRVVELTRDSR